jgi:hypothetical protein
MTPHALYLTRKKYGVTLCPVSPGRWGYDNWAGITYERGRYLSHPDLEGTMTGDVGIFWIDRGQLIMAAVPLAEGVDDGLFINGMDDHDPYWETVQRTHTHLWDFEYDQVPRGRVLFNKAEHRFYIYLDKVLCKATIKHMIMGHFRLPPAMTIFQTDLHYTTDPVELDQLFSR